MRNVLQQRICLIMAAENLEKRIIDLEKKVSFQEQTIGELNDACMLQQKKIFEFEKRLSRLNDELSSDPLVKNPEDEEPPPHY